MDINLEKHEKTQKIIKIKTINNNVIKVCEGDNFWRSELRKQGKPIHEL